MLGGGKLHVVASGWPFARGYEDSHGRGCSGRGGEPFGGGGGSGGRIAMTAPTSPLSITSWAQGNAREGQRGVEKVLAAF